MQRRSFLRDLAAMVPAAAMPAALSAQAGTGKVPELHRVGAHEDRTGHPHSLGFSTILFRVTTAETAGRVFLMEHQQMQAHKGPNLHLHVDLDEWFYVLEGEVIFQVGEQRLRLGAGESVLGPRMVPHTFASIGDAPGRLLIGFSPAGKMEEYFLDKGSANPPSRPDGYYGTRDIGPSPFWQSGM